MGQVWRAHHAALKRDDALKVLPYTFAADPERLARFQREAQILASLNHPNIAIIHGLEEADGVKALVMELVEGPTLADRIAHGPLPIDESLSIAKQIVEALEAAHEKGIVHRDLKPANIKVRPDGTVKVLDFGLAKAVEPAGTTSSGSSQSPTLTSPAHTMQGVILGTAAYMSPEQARGKSVDRRTDIWAFGCTLYEMLVGRRAFEGESVNETIGAVIHKDPDWSRLPPSTPPSMQRLLRRSLQKDPAGRLRDIGDAGHEILEAQTGSWDDAGAARPPAPRGSVAQRMALIAVVASALVVSLWIWVRWGAEVPTVTKVILGWRGDTGPSLGTHFALSPDGRRFAYVGLNGGLWVRDFDDLDPRPLPGTDQASLPFFAPDGQSVAFVTVQGALKVASIQGGSVRTVIARSVSAQGGDWTSDGMIYFSRPAEGVWKVASIGGTPERVSQPDSVGVTHTRVNVLPDGRGAFVTSYQESANTSEIGVLDFSTGKVAILFQGVQARFAATGHVIYATADGTLHAAPFDQGRLEVTGSATPLVERVSASLYSPGALFDVSDTGTLLYKTESPAQSEAVWVTRSGVATPLDREPWVGQFFSMSLSPDGKQIVATLTTGTRQDVWTRSLETGTVSRLTFEKDGSLNYRAKWTADGRALTFISNRSGVAGELWKQPSDGSAPAERVASDGPLVDEGLVSPDGQWAVYRAGGSELVGRDIKAVRLGSGTPTPLVATSADEYSPTLSPDGRWLAYVSNESGIAQVYVRPFPESEAAVWQVSTGGGRGPVWSQSGKELFYQTARNELAAVETRGGATFTWSSPRLLFDLSDYELNPWHPTYDVARDGERFLMARRVGDPSTEVVLTQNWFHEVKHVLQGRR